MLIDSEIIKGMLESTILMRRQMAGTSSTIEETVRREAVIAAYESMLEGVKRLENNAAQPSPRKKIKTEEISWNSTSKP